MSKKQSMAIDFAGQPAPAPWVWQWLVSGSGKAPYKVSVRKFLGADVTQWGCTCPASRFMQDGERSCKHVLRLQVAALTTPDVFNTVPGHVRALLGKALENQPISIALANIFSDTTASPAIKERRIKVVQ
jgi:hypothetical protein